MNTSNRHPTLAAALWRAQPVQALSLNAAVRIGLMVAIGVALLTISAKVQIPFYPVPITMQTFVVLLVGFAYGKTLGASTVLLYLAAGAFGLPVFAGTPEKGIGIAYMLGPTGGYLLGFVFAAILCGALAEKGWDRRVLSTFAAMAFGNLIIYACGLFWLGTLLGWDKPILQWGLLPFLPGGIAKIALAMIVLPGAWKLLRKGR